MADIRIDYIGELTDGQSVTFIAPCNCNEITGLKVYYFVGTERTSKSFTIRDTMGNDLTGIGNLFKAGAYVHTILDTTNGYAYLQNAATNGYLNQKLSSVPTIRVGTDAPDDSIGEDGDIYIQVVS